MDQAFSQFEYQPSGMSKPAKLIIAIIVITVVCLLIYNYACELPLFNILCPVIKVVWKVLGYAYTGVSWVFGKI